MPISYQGLSSPVRAHTNNSWKTAITEPGRSFSLGHDVDLKDKGNNKTGFTGWLLRMAFDQSSVLSELVKVNITQPRKHLCKIGLRMRIKRLLSYTSQSEVVVAFCY